MLADLENLQSQSRLNWLRIISHSNDKILLKSIQKTVFWLASWPSTSIPVTLNSQPLKLGSKTPKSDTKQTKNPKKHAIQNRDPQSITHVVKTINKKPKTEKSNSGKQRLVWLQWGKDSSLRERQSKQSMKWNQKQREDRRGRSKAYLDRFTGFGGSQSQPYDRFSDDNFLFSFYCYFW